MPVVFTDEIELKRIGNIQQTWFRGHLLNSSEQRQVYCGLDCGVTLEVREELAVAHPEAGGLPGTGAGPSNQPSPLAMLYDFERGLQAPYLEIMQRGFLIDEISRQEACRQLRLRLDKLESQLHLMASAVWDFRDAKGSALNPRSPDQLKKFFYGEMRLPEVWISQKGEKKLSTNREALEKLDQYLYARPFVSTILAIRDLAKQLNVLETEIDPDGRMRTSYNIGGTETGRPSSSTSAHGTGTNLQNIAPSLRFVFVADPGKKICVIDLAQVEARDVGFICGCLFNDWTYLDNCESGDLHTNNCKLVWPELGWSGDPKKDREIADQIYYRDFTRRDMLKRGGHLKNYFGTDWTASRHLKIPIALAEQFGSAYIGAFPVLPKWWQWTAEQLQTTHTLWTPFGRRRLFFGRPGDDTTLREGIAFQPQGNNADRTNLILWRVWKKYGLQVDLLAQTYDSITFQYPESLPDDEILPLILKEFEVTLVAPNNGRKYTVPGEAKVGFNWGNYTTREDIEKARKAGKKLPRLNLDGLRKWTPGKPDTRVRQVGLKRVMA
jgi:hypothetical protein